MYAVLCSLGNEVGEKNNKTGFFKVRILQTCLLKKAFWLPNSINNSVGFIAEAESFVFCVFFRHEHKLEEWEPS